ncbi:hypothetical protein BDR26DRAFT_851733 [Obelidium mucronatum]|nr:hypothetical protein BDR26DRAFT_851733 [Obelidium mucronatum]
MKHVNFNLCFIKHVLICWCLACSTRFSVSIINDERNEWVLRNQHGFKVLLHGCGHCDGWCTISVLFSLFDNRASLL